MDDDLVPPSMPGQVQLSKKQSFFKKLFSKNSSQEDVSLEKSINMLDNMKDSIEHDVSPLSMQAPAKINPTSQIDFSAQHHDEIDLDKLRQHLGLPEDNTSRPTNSSSGFNSNPTTSSFASQAPTPVKKSMSDFFVKGDEAGDLKVDYSPVQTTNAPKKAYTPFEFDNKKLGVEEPTRMSKKMSSDIDTTYFTNTKTYEPKNDSLAKKSGVLNFASSIENISHDELHFQDQEMNKSAWDQFDWTKHDLTADEEIKQASDLAKSSFTDDVAPTSSFVDDSKFINDSKFATDSKFVDNSKYVVDNTKFTEEPKSKPKAIEQITKEDIEEMEHELEEKTAPQTQTQTVVAPVPVPIVLSKEKSVDDHHANKNLFQLSNGETRLVKADLKKEVEKLKKDRQELEHQKISIAGNMQKLTVKEKQIEKEKAALEESKKEFAAQTAAFEAKKRDSDDLVHKLPSLKREYAAMQQDLEELKKTIRKNQDKIIGLESEIKNLEKHKSQKEESFAQKERAIDEKIAANKRLEENLAKRERALEEAQNTLHGMESTIRQTGFTNYLGQELDQKTVIVPSLEGKQDLKKNPHEEAYVLVNQCRNLINQNKINEAKHAYLKAWEEYNKMLESGAENEELYQLVRELYDDLTGSELL